MPIPVNYSRLHRALFEINKELDLTRAEGHYQNRLRASHARNIIERMNELRERNHEWHSALQFAAAAEQGISNARRALYRRAISLYGRWTYQAMIRNGYTGSEFAFYAGSQLEEPIKVSGFVERTCDANGQYRFIQ